MKRWKIAFLLPALCLSLWACGRQAAPQGEEPPSSALRWDQLTWDDSLELEYAQLFSVDYGPEGYARLVIDGAVYLLLPEGGEIPAGLPEDVTAIPRPADRIYLQATAAMDCFRKLDAVGAVTLSGLEAKSWYIPEAKAAMEAGRMAYAGKYSAPDYELIQSSGCGLTIASTMIYHNPEVKEQLERLGVPVLVERSSYESHPLGRMEWIKLYGVLLGKEEEAASYFDQQLKQLEPALEQENTGKTVAFFAITANGMVTVRKPGDYIAKAIQLAGGVYALQDLGGDENALSTMNIQMEAFYQQAKDADILIYNSAIESALETREQLIAKSPALADFKAVQNGDVWCTGKSMFQESQSVGEMILDMHKILTEGPEAEGSLTYLYRLQ